jgi:hypothetical protein
LPKAKGIYIEEMITSLINGTGETESPYPKE